MLEEWTHNLQYLALAMPRATDAEHHAALEDFHRALARLVDRHFGDDGAIQYHGFHRADANGDNIDRIGACVNFPTRGNRSATVDNEP